METTVAAGQRLSQQLANAKLKLVLAESCTAGNVAGSLAAIPGISSYLCGSYVVYRNESKAAWLGIDRALLDDPAIGPVSAQVTKLLAQSALKATPEADIAAAVTGHIGPGCPVHLDGSVFFCLVSRNGANGLEVSCRLKSPAPKNTQDIAARQLRLTEATQWVLEQILSCVQTLVNDQEFK